MKNRYLVFLGSLLAISCATQKPAEPAQIAAVQELPAETAAVSVKPAAIKAPETVSAAPAENRRHEITGIAFIADTVPALNTVPGVGNITRESRDRALSLSDNEKSVLSGAFRDAYTDGLLRGQSLTGVLGGDQVHGWPQAAPISWAQNWQTSQEHPNSWGLPALVLAAADKDIADENNQCRVFTVQGDILDFYGRGLGVNGANGNAGFGSPRSQEFFYQGNLAQRFDLGLIVIGEDGKGYFSSESPPSLALEEFLKPDLIFQNGAADNGIYAAFASAWKIASDSYFAGSTQILVPDSSIQYVAFPWDSYLWKIIPGNITRGFYILTFNRRTSVLILPDTTAILDSSGVAAVPQTGLPLHARFIGSPFLDLLTTGLPLAGTEIPADFSFDSDDEFIRDLTLGFAVYGMPLTDPVFRISPGDFAQITEQRFSNGWLRIDPNY